MSERDAVRQGERGQTAARFRARSAVLAFLLVTITILGLVRDRSDWAQAGPVWWSMILGISLVVLGGVLVVGIAAGVLARKRAKRADHA